MPMAHAFTANAGRHPGVWRLLFLNSRKDLRCRSLQSARPPSSRNTQPPKATPVLRSPGRDPDRAHQQPDRTLQGSQEGQPLASWPSDHGFEPPFAARLPEEEGRRPLHEADHQPRHPPLNKFPADLPDEGPPVAFPGQGETTRDRFRATIARNERQAGWAGSVDGQPMTCHGAGLLDASAPEGDIADDPPDPKPPTVLPVIASAHCRPPAPALPAGRRSAYEGQDMFDVHSVEIEWAGRPLKLETGKIARQADGAVLAPMAKPLFSPPSFRQGAEAGAGLLPAHRQLPGKDLCRRQDPGWLLQARKAVRRKTKRSFRA